MSVLRLRIGGGKASHRWGVLLTPLLCYWSWTWDSGHDTLTLTFYIKSNKNKQTKPNNPT
jgi:hypothetical protein